MNTSSNYIVKYFWANLRSSFGEWWYEKKQMNLEQKREGWLFSPL